MTISNLRLLEGIGQALQVIAANSSDAMSKAQVHAASIAVDELRKRDNAETQRTRYAQGRQLVGALLDKSDNAKLKSTFAALPAAMRFATAVLTMMRVKFFKRLCQFGLCQTLLVG